MNRMTLLLALASVVSGCKPDMPYLTHVEEIARSPKCPGGGAVITTGRDWSHDRVLDEREVLERTEICNGLVRDNDGGVVTVNSGRNGLNALITTATLPLGDTRCPNGGVQISTGIDEPADGGGGNGVLDPGEVQSVHVVCNGAAPTFERSIDEPAGPLGHSTISANGGHSTGPLGTKGGNGGVIEIAMGGTLGGNLKVFKTGSVDAGFEWPVDSFEAGPLTFEVSAPTTVLSYPSMAGGLASGLPYFVVSSSGKLMKRVDAQTAAEVSSIVVLSRASLEIEAVNLTHDFRLDGWLFSSRSSAKLSIAARRLSIGASARLVLNSTLDAAASQLHIQVDEFRNEGRIDFGREIVIQARHVWNRGSIFVGGFGGAGGYVSLRGTDVASSGLITAPAGNPASDGSNGFRGGSVYIVAYGGSVRLSGEVRAEGSSCTKAACVGGAGGEISVMAQNGDVRSSATLVASAGQGIARGGAGGWVSLQSSSLRALPSGSLQLSGPANVEGGSGAVGGNGGEVHILLDPHIAQGQEIELLGYSNITATGGQGATTGSTGGSVQLRSSFSGRLSVPSGPSGAIVNCSAVDVSGGDGDTSNGGSISFETWNEQAYVTPLELIRNSGHLIVNGGGSLLTGGRAGGVAFSSAGRIENTANIDATGTSDGERGVSGGSVSLRSSDSVTNSGSINASGRAGSKRGGAGGHVDIGGTQITNSASVIETNGGPGSVAGGNAGTISLLSTLIGTRNSAALQAAPGLGATNGEPGSIVVY